MFVYCADRGLYGDREGDRAIIFGGSFERMAERLTDGQADATGQAESETANRDTATAFEPNDQIEVYAANENQQLRTGENRIYNACFKVSSDGQIKGNPTLQ